MPTRTFPGSTLLVLACVAIAIFSLLRDVDDARRAMREAETAPASRQPTVCETKEAGLTMTGATRLSFDELAAYEDVARDLLERLGQRQGARKDPRNYLYFHFALADGVQQIWVAPSVCRLNQRGVDFRYWVRADRRIIDVEEGM
ncbi:MAG: hypothetical protein HY749_14005 [Gammaproteobacteria bacterium]|nr:hypothetical protein [Gammaproteobacteria bacterium]